MHVDPHPGLHPPNVCHPPVALPAAGISPLPGACLCFFFSIKGRQSLETETDNALEIEVYSIKLGS
jgi:hypothetical protein